MNKKPKILICTMSCCDSFYLREEELIKNTWLRLCKNFDNIDYIIFRGNANKTQFINKHLVLINCPDDLAGTYDKNYLLFKLLKEQNIEFDYLLAEDQSYLTNYQDLPFIIDNGVILTNWVGQTTIENIYVGNLDKALDELFNN